MPYGNESPASKMGPYHMESAKQEKKDLLQDNPVAKDASGGRSWMSKHSQSGMSPLREGHEGAPMKKKGSMAYKAGPGDLDGDGKMSGYEANRQKAIEKAMAKKGS